MFSLKLDVRNPNWKLLKTSFWAFVAGAVLPFLIEAVFGYNLFIFFWVFLGVAFHEVGHLFFLFLVTPFLKVLGFWLAYKTTPLDYLGGYLFSCILAIVLLVFSLGIQSRIYQGKIREKFQLHVFSFMFLAYVNLYFVNFTITHLTTVVGSGRDFTMASSLLLISLPELISWMWVVHWITFTLAILLNVFFVFRKRS